MKNNVCGFIQLEIPQGLQRRAKFLTGFTLLEILIAITIMALILIIIYGSYTGSVQIITENGDDFEIYHIARFFLNTISEELSCAYDGGSSVPFKGETKGLEFTSTNKSGYMDYPPESGDFYRLKYSLGNTSSTQGNYIMYRDEDGQSDVIGEDIRDINFEYYDGKTWEEKWDSVESKKLPTAVRITLNMDKKGVTVTFNTVVSIQAAYEGESSEGNNQK